MFPVQVLAPRIDVETWVRVMSRRIEAQLARDWTFGFVTWNYMFRSAVNLSRNFFAYDAVRVEEGSIDRSEPLTPDMLEKGAIEIMRALYGKYLDPSGKMRCVSGDMTKVRYVPGLSSAAQRLLQNIEHTSRRLPGTQETRRLMRFDTHGNRIRHGVPIFVTFHPDEAHSLLMVRLSRTRRTDPVFANGNDPIGHKFCGMSVPSIEEDVSSVSFPIPNSELAEFIPSYENRKRILARDSLASVDGFHMLVLAAYEYLFGMRVCPFCPHCNNSSHGRPCQDLFGSNALAEGGIFGRIDAGYTSIEAQKSTGSLHAHSQLFVQCLHQHTPLAEIMLYLKQTKDHLVKDYLVYKERVCRQVYARADEHTEKRLWENEKSWPEYAQSTLMISRPSYLTKRDTKVIHDHGPDRCHEEQQGLEWASEYLATDVQALQEHKQHHVHIYNPETDSREPLQACRRKDNPKECKAELPRVHWLIDRAVVLCQGLLKQLGMASSGRRSKLGSLHGPMNHPCLNGTHPAMLAAQRFNSDVPISVSNYRRYTCT